MLIGQTMLLRHSVLLKINQGQFRDFTKVSIEDCSVQCSPIITVFSIYIYNYIHIYIYKHLLNETHKAFMWATKPELIFGCIR